MQGSQLTKVIPYRVPIKTTLTSHRTTFSKKVVSIHVTLRREFRTFHYNQFISKQTILLGSSFKVRGTY